MRSRSLRLADAISTGVSPRSRIGAQHRLAADAREHEVEHDQVDRIAVDRLDGRASVAHDRDLVTVPFEVQPQDLGQARLVLDDQDPGVGGHGRHPSRAVVKES